MCGNAPSSGNAADDAAEREYLAWEDAEAVRLTDKWQDLLERQFLRSSSQ